MVSSVAACADVQMSAAKLAARKSPRFMSPSRSNPAAALLLGSRPLFVIVQLLLQRRVMHADQERRLLARRMLDQREARCREGVAGFPSERLAVDGRLARAFDDMMHRR